MQDAVQLNSNLTVKGQTSLSNDVTIYGKAYLQDAVQLNSSLTVKGQTSLSNDVTIYGKAYLQDAVTTTLLSHGGITSCNYAKVCGAFSVLGVTSLCNELVVKGSQTCYSNVTVHGALNTLSTLQFGSNSWTVGVSNTSMDLVFTSLSNNRSMLTDTFSPSLLNFQGKCLCKVAPGTPQLVPGMLVVSRGQYADLSGATTIDVDNAIPVIDLTSSSNDPTAFGVVSYVEPSGADTRDCQIGFLKFTVPAVSPRAIVNTSGQGGILVCDSNGNIDNGDLLVSSATPGYAMRQGTDVYTAATVAKATCDFRFTGQTSSALIGCVYKF
jgi:hypothetical protein